MVESNQLSIYSVDTSAFMDWQARAYPPDVFPGMLQAVNSMVGGERLLACELVSEELAAVGTGELLSWSTANKEIYVPTRDLLSTAIQIQNQFPGLRDPKAEFEEADAYVIALARLRDGVVVTQETPAAEKLRPRRTHFIPDVCRELGLPCISWLGMMRREGWVF
jgi:hypothetical protein